jgi:hypothetical protein
MYTVYDLVVYILYLVIYILYLGNLVHLHHKISNLGMSTNIRTFEYSFDGLIFEYEIDTRIFGHIFFKGSKLRIYGKIPLLSLLFSRNTLLLCLRKGSIGHIVNLAIEPTI